MPGYEPKQQSSDPFADLDALDKSSAPAPAPKPPAKPATTPPDKSASQPTGETKVDHPIDPNTPPDDAQDEHGVPRSPKALRKAFDTASSELKASKTRLAELESKLAKLEASPGNTERLEAHVSEQIETMKKQLEEKESRLQLLAFEQSDKFKTEYEDKYNEALALAKEDLSQLTVTLEDGSTRQATENDFAFLRRLPLQQAYTKAKEMFGDAAGVIMEHRRAIEGIVRASNAAVQKHKAEFAEHQKREQVKVAQEREARSAMWTKVNKELSERFAYFRPTTEADADHDPEVNALLDKGFKEADSMFHNRGTMTPQEQVLLDARIRNQSAAFRPTLHKLKKAQTRITELEAQLAEFQQSEPGDVRRSAGGEKPGGEKKPKTWEEGIDAMPER